MAGLAAVASLTLAVECQVTHYPLEASLGDGQTLAGGVGGGGGGGAAVKDGGNERDWRRQGFPR